MKKFDRQRYADTLLRYLDAQDEALLAQAYALGRQAMENGIGVSQVTQLFFELVSNRVGSLNEAALPFLLETTAPFEMALRGYDEAVKSLRQLNESLEESIEERTSELQASQERLHQAQKLDMIGRLAGGISHDFNNLLCVILTYADVILSEAPADAPLRDDVLEIRHAAERGAALTKQLLAFSRQQNIDSTSVNVRAAIEATIQMLRRLVPVAINISLAEVTAERYVVTGRGQFEQIVMNLVLNACDALEGQGDVMIRINDAELDSKSARAHDVEPGKYVVIEISDTGTGIMPEQLGQIFEPFFTTKPIGKGTGLGLPTAHGIVRKSGGTITVDSAPGRGSTFSVYLPNRNAESQPEKKRATAIGTPKEALLLVEDDLALLHGLSRYLREYGFDMFEASNGEDALSLLDTEPTIGLVITDVSMPNTSGVKFFDLAKKRFPDLPFVFTSGYVDQQVLPSDATVHFVQKPFTPSELFLLVCDILNVGTDR